MSIPVRVYGHAGQGRTYGSSQVWCNYHGATHGPMDWGDLCSEDDLTDIGTALVKGHAMPPEFEDTSLVDAQQMNRNILIDPVAAADNHVQWTGHPAEYLQRLSRPDQMVVARAAGQVAACADMDYDAALDAVTMMCMAFGRMMFDTIERCDRAREVEARITASNL